MLDAFDALIRQLGPWGALLIGLAALLEYLVPPLPGDTITLLGGAFVARGEQSFLVVLASLMLFSVAGMAATWAVGRVIGVRFGASPRATFLFGLTRERLERAQDTMRRRGDWVLLLNRFMPSFRALVFLVAGASGTPLRRVLALGSVSALAWNAMLLVVGMTLGAKAELLEGWLSRYRLIALVAALALVVMWLLFRRRRS